MTRIVALVPTLGRSPAAAGLAADLARELEPYEGLQLWVHQGPAPEDGEEGASLFPLESEPLARESGTPAPRIRFLRLPEPRGFAAAVHAGLAALAPETQWVALVNDDCRLEPGWLGCLLEQLEREPRAGAAQGVVLRAGTPARLDGYGLGWNRWYEAVQLGHGEPLEAAPREAIPIPGVSATAALYRRCALEEIGGRDLEIFGPELVSHYEDVELALELRARGWSAWCVPQARAVHLGGATTRHDRLRSRIQIRGNRWAVAARWLGRSFWLALPRILLLDLRDLARSVVRKDRLEARAILLGWKRALRLLPGRLHFRRAAPPPRSMRSVA